MRKDKPSRTAIKVTVSVVTLGAKPGAERMLPAGLLDASEKLLLASGVVGETAIRLTKSPRMVAVYEAFDWLLPGQFEALGERKAFCERQVRDAIGAGARQVLVLGAGFDTLGWRLAPEFPGVSFFEIDHPATARPKARGIAAMGARDNLFLIAEDLGKRKLEDTLAANEAWRPDEQSIIVAEGLLMYLPATAVMELLSQCAAISGTGSRIAFSYIPADSDGNIDAGRWTGLMLWLQRVAGEAWVWGLHPDDIGPFLEQNGWNNEPAREGNTGKHGIEYFIVASKAS